MSNTERVEPTFVERNIDDDNYGTLSGLKRNTKKRKSNDDDDDSEISWTQDVEDYIRDLLKKSEDAAEAHEAAGHRAKKRHSWCAFPAMLIPSVSAPIVGVCRDDDWSSYFAVSSLVLTAAFNGFSTFFNFGEKSQKHFNFAGRYSDIVTDIQECLCKVKSKRVPGQVALRTFKMQYDSLALSAPET